MGAPIRILVVEDEPVIAEMLREWVIELGCEPVGPVSSADAAMALLADKPVAGAILDIAIAGGNSYEIATKLRECGAPFVFATGHGSEDLDPQFRDAALLLKPFNFDDLAGFVEPLRKLGG